MIRLAAAEGSLPNVASRASARRMGDALHPAQPFFNILSLPPDRHHLNGYLQNASLPVSRELTTNDVLETG